jgi:hypothetical protein
MAWLTVEASRSAMDHCRLEELVEARGGFGSVSAASRRAAAARTSSRPTCDSVSDTRTGAGVWLGEAFCTSILGGLRRSNRDDRRLIGLDGGC